MVANHKAGATSTSALVGPGGRALTYVHRLKRPLRKFAPGYTGLDGSGRMGVEPIISGV